MDKPRILVLDDDGMIGALLEDYLDELGFETAGPATTLGEALELVRREAISGAILDVRLKDGDTSYPLAELLLEKGTPFAFSTGYDSGSIAQHFSSAKTLAKPFVLQDLRLLIESWQLSS
jgi:DNA-binding response OmpR family regulator